MIPSPSVIAQYVYPRLDCAEGPLRLQFSAVDSQSREKRFSSSHALEPCAPTRGCSAARSMGRTASPKKPSVSNRSLSSRLGVVSAPSPLRFGSGHSASPATSSTGTPVPSIALAMPAQKRAFDDAVGPATPGGAAVGATSSSNRSRPDKRSRRQKRKATQQPADTGKELAATATATGDADLEEGEVVEGDFSDLFMVDTTPAAVKPKDRFVPTEAPNAATPSKKTTGEPEDLVLKPLAAAAEGEELLLAETSMPDAADDDESALDSDDAMRIFAREVAMTDDSDNAEDENDDSDSDEEDEDEPAEEDDFGAAAGQGLMLYDDEEQLQQAIQGRIVDDSAAPVRLAFLFPFVGRTRMLTLRGRLRAATTRKPT